MSPEARDRSFDELARGLASGEVSRGKALRLMGAALVGGALASVPRVAAAQDGVCPSASACCSCEYAERDNPEETTRRKCFPQTTGSCSEERISRLVRQCDRLCRENRPEGTVVRQRTATCVEGVFGAQTFCGAGTARPRVCGFEFCEAPAGAAGASEGQEEGRFIHRWP
jgi:hypothetical protein